VNATLITTAVAKLADKVHLTAKVQVIFAFSMLNIVISKKIVWKPAPPKLAFRWSNLGPAFAPFFEVVMFQG
jgi:hypothetical protein